MLGQIFFYKICVDVLGTKSDQLEFDTKSGKLIARQSDSGIILDFPSNPPRPLGQAETAALGPVIEAVAGDLGVQEVLLSQTTYKLLIRLEDRHSRFDIQGLGIGS